MTIIMRDWSLDVIWAHGERSVWPVNALDFLGQIISRVHNQGRIVVPFQICHNNLYQSRRHNGSFTAADLDGDGALIIRKGKKVYHKVVQES